MHLRRYPTHEETALARSEAYTDGMKWGASALGLCACALVACGAQQELGSRTPSALPHDAHAAVAYEDTTCKQNEVRMQTGYRQKPTVVAVSTVDQPVPGAHLMLPKPVTGESCVQSLKIAYFRMLRDHRRHARYAVMTPVTAEDQNHRSIPITISDIGDGGIGLITKELLAIGDVLSFRLWLPQGDRSIYIEARVLWTRQYGAAGCEFLRIPPVDLGVLQDWLKLKCRIKQPLIAL